MTDAMAVARAVVGGFIVPEPLQFFLRDSEGHKFGLSAWTEYLAEIERQQIEAIAAALREREQAVWREAAMILDACCHLCVGDAATTALNANEFRRRAGTPMAPPRAGREGEAR